MTVYVDETQHYGARGDWCHMWADSEDELHTFARKLGLRPEWGHLSKGLSGDFMHYDLRPRKRAMALKRGAQFKPLRDYVRERMLR